MSINEGLFTSATPEWATPQDFFDELNREFGGFLLDVCATDENAKCRRYFTRRENGLVQKWSKRNWMNPPYGKTIGQWIHKASVEATAGNLTVALLPARTDTKWFHSFIYGRHEVRLVRGRLKFGGSKNSAPFPSMVVVFKRSIRH